MKKRKRLSMSLTFLLTSVIFVIMFLTMTIMGLIMCLVISLRVQKVIPLPEIWRPIPQLVAASAIVGTLMAAVLSRIPMKPARQLITAINELAAGNFDVRIHFHGTEALEQLSESFNRMAKELGSTEMLRSDFINNFSHEFKTPIVSLRGFAKLLKSEELTKEERDEYLDIIISESTRLSQLATNVLNLSKVENLNIIAEREPFDLAEQVRQAILLLEPKWTRKSLDMIVDLDESTFCGNPQLLNQVWINLIDNAVKFTPENTKVKIKLRDSADQVTVEVMDNGYGIDEAAKEHIFDRFYQGDASHATEGNGIGLTIVQRIVELCRGTIAIRSEPGIGTSFLVTLPKRA